MSIQAVAFVLDTEVPEVAAKMLLVCLANAHNNETGLCCPSIGRLAEESSMSRRSVQRWLKWLQDHDYITVIHNSNDAGRQQSNTYSIAGFNRGARMTPLLNVGGVTGDMGDTGDTGEGDTGDTLGGDTVGTPLKEPEEYRKKEPTAQSAGGVRDFEESLWVDFPRAPNSRKAPALKAFLRLKPADRMACIRGAARYSLRFEEDQSDKRPLEQRLRYVPHLVTWINQRGWEQELETA